MVQPRFLLNSDWSRASQKRRLPGHRLWLGCLFLALLVGAVACREDTPGATPTPEAAPMPETAPTPITETALLEEPSPTPVPPTPTPEEPLAALVNGEPVFLADYERELARYEQALTMLDVTEESGEIGPQDNGEPAVEAEATPEVDAGRLVLDALIERKLILQAAAAAGVVVEPAAVAARVEELRSSTGETTNFDAWLQSNLFTEDEFHEALAAEMVTEQMVNIVTSAVPQTLEQVRARYIQVSDPALAQDIVNRARAGDDFGFLARQHSLDRLTGENGGDLGFFAPGSLLVGEIEQAAFALQPGETSDVITATGTDGQTRYYVVQVIERDPNRSLTADMRFAMLQQTFEAWLEQLWNQATIERLIDT